MLLGSVQAAFLIALIFGKKRKMISDWVLVAWVALLGTHHLLPILFDSGVVTAPAWHNLNAGVPLLQGPFLYLYVQSLTSGRKRLGLLDLLHLVPFALFGVYVQWLLPDFGQTAGAQVSVFRLSSLVTAAILVSVPAYALTSLRLLRKHRVRTLESHSEMRGRDLSWLRWIVLALLAVWCVVIAAAVAEYLAPGSAHGGWRHQLMSAITLFIYVIGYFGFRQIAVGEPDEPAEQPLQPLSRPQAGKYQRSGLKSEETDALLVQLSRYLDEQKPYLEEAIALRQVAARLEVSPNHLSQAINQGLNKNFYELINERRVEEFKRRVLDSKNRSYTLLAIALDSGFSSKSSFNRVFKQLTGISPRQYVERQTSSDA